MQITVWNDYVCPWAYAARPLTAWLRDFGQPYGVEVTTRSYELHPELPPEGHPVRPGGRLDTVFDHIATECSASGQAFNRPSVSPNTHRVLALAEVVRVHTPAHFDQVDAALAKLHWVDGGDLSDQAQLDATLAACGADVDAIRELEADGEGERLLVASMAEARELEVSATPAWRIGEMTIVGLHPPEQFQRWATRLVERNCQ